MQHIPYRKDIDALRGIAVLFVVIYHAFPNILPGGFIGVDIFFVISGFLITSIILDSISRGEFSIRDFYSRRIRRLFPALLLVLSFVVIIGWFILFPEEYQQLGKHISKSVIFWLNFELIDEVGYFDVESHYKPLLHLWSLSVEEQYYLLWPLILVFIPNRHSIYLISIFLVLSLTASIYFSKDYPNESFFHTLTRFWQLASGSLLAILMLNKKLSCSGSKAYIYMVTGITTIFLGGVLINNNSIYPGFLAIVPVLGALLIITANVQLKHYFGLVKLGLISYPLYLWHWVFISFAYIYLGRKPDDSMLFSIVLLSIVFSYLTYKYVEVLRYKKRSTLYLLAGFVIIGLVGHYIKKEKGLADRSSMQNYSRELVQFEREPARDKECIEHANSILDNKRIFDYCRADNLNKPKLLGIIGDSHAHVLFPGISTLAEKHGYGTLLLANSSCPPLQGFMWGRNEKEITDCKVKIKQIFQILEQDSRIQKVIVTTRGPAYIHGEVEGTFTEDSVERSLATKIESKASYKTYFNGFSASMQKLESLKHVKKVLYMLENPELDFLAKEVIPRPYDYFDISVNRDYMDRDLYLKRMSIYRENLNRISYPKLIMLDPIDALCDEEKCHSQIDGKSLYADDDHFSVYGSEYIAQYFQNQIFTGE